MSTIYFYRDDFEHRGTIVIPDFDYSIPANSGPHGKGKLPRGEYVIKTRDVVTGPHMKDSFRDPISGLKYFIPIELIKLDSDEPVSQLERDGFGIHPDGNIPGTLGCIYPIGIYAILFWVLFTNLPMKDRWTRLIVTDKQTYIPNLKKLKPKPVAWL